MPPQFHPFGTSHHVVLVLTAVLLGGMLVIARTRFAGTAEKTLGTVLLLVYPATLAGHAWIGSLNAQTLLPLQYCDIACLAGGVALWTRRQFFCEIVYFFGIAGTSQGLITPALQFDFPDPRFFAFFTLHSGVTIAAVYVVTGLRYRPAPGAVWRIMTFSVSWYAVTAVINVMLGTNYAFQCAKPVNASLFDQLGPWPWYNFTAIGLGVVFYSVLYLPFVFRKSTS